MNWRSSLFTALLFTVLFPDAVFAEWAITLRGYSDDRGHAGLERPMELAVNKLPSVFWIRPKMKKLDELMQYAG